MPTDYTVLTLSCPRCATTFLVMTELQNHHLAAHERWLAGHTLPPVPLPVLAEAP